MKKKRTLAVHQCEGKKEEERNPEKKYIDPHFSVHVKLRDLPGAVGRGPHLFSGLLVGGDEVDLGRWLRKRSRGEREKERGREARRGQRKTFKKMKTPFSLFLCHSPCRTRLS